jgi:hypothetical protein
VIATSANAHRHAAAPAAIQPVALLPLLHPTPPQHWTAPGRTGLNDVRKIAPTGIAPLEARGFLIGFPGLLCLGVTASLSGNGPCAAEPRNPRPRKHRAELLPPMAAHCASSTSETPSEKPKKSQIRLLGPWWSNRVYPQNHAVFSPRSQQSLRLRPHSKSAYLSASRLLAREALAEVVSRVQRSIGVGPAKETPVGE